MSQENVEVVRSIYGAVNRGDWVAAFRDQHPDAVTILPPPYGTLRGREDIQGHWEDRLGAFDTSIAEPREVVESGDQVVAVVRLRARPKGSSAEIEIRVGHLWTFRDGKVASMQLFPQPEKALQAAGLTE
jgi:ketosteroid isomerase-like protein